METNNGICTYCPEPATGHTAPLMCDRHLDLAVLTEYLRDQGEPVTVEAVQGLVHICQERNGILHLEVEEVEALLTGDFAERYNITGPRPAGGNNGIRNQTQSN